MFSESSVLDMPSSWQVHDNKEYLFLDFIYAGFRTESSVKMVWKCWQRWQFVWHCEQVVDNYHINWSVCL